MSSLTPQNTESYLATLLHDIGKFWRANFNKELKIKNFELNIQDESEYKNILLKEFFSSISIRERKEDSNNNISTDNSICTKDSNKNTSTKDSNNNKSNSYYSISKINDVNVDSISSLDNYFFPQLSDTSNGIGTFTNHFEKLQNEINLVFEHIKNDVHKINTLFYVLNKYGSRIPSIDDETISLFDNIRSSLAIKSSVSECNGTRKALILKCDISGIQKFIYSNIEKDEAGATRGLSKKLRGRSFFINLLTDVLSSFIAYKLDLFEFNVIFSGGGHFLMILPPYKKNEIEKIIFSLNHSIFKQFTFDISLNYALEEVTLNNDNQIIDLEQVLNKIEIELKNKKNKKFIHSIENVFKLNSQSQNDFKNHYKKNEYFDKFLGDSLPYAQNLVLTLVNKDDHLAQNNFLKVSDYLKIDLTDEDTILLFVLDNNKVTKFIQNLNNSINCKWINIVKINSTNFLEFASQLSSISNIFYSFKFVNNAAPKDEKDEIYSFEEIAKLNYSSKESDNSLDYPSLGILRLDVDNLALIFAEGFSNELKLEKYSALSRELHLFFSARLNYLANKFKIYTTYSGGDDAFFVGSWYNIIHFSKDLNQEFRRFVCENKHITISAGIFICHDNFPVYRFAEMAEEMENKSKNYPPDKNKPKKNAITVFDKTTEWRCYEKMLKFAEDILKLIPEDVNDSNSDKGKLSRSLIYKVHTIIKKSISKSGKYGEILDISKLNKNIPLLHYLFARHGYNEQFIKKPEMSNEIIHLIVKNFLLTDIKEPNAKPHVISDTLKNYLISTSYVILKTRKLKNKNNKK